MCEVGSCDLVFLFTDGIFMASGYDLGEDSTWRKVVKDEEEIPTNIV